MDGLVSFTNLNTPGQTTIDGANITTGTISADRIDVTNLTVNKLDGATGTFTSLSAAADGVINLYPWYLTETGLQNIVTGFKIEALSSSNTSIYSTSTDITVGPTTASNRWLYLQGGSVVIETQGNARLDANYFDLFPVTGNLSTIYGNGNLLIETTATLEFKARNDMLFNPSWSVYFQPLESAFFNPVDNTVFSSSGASRRIFIGRPNTANCSELTIRPETGGTCNVGTTSYRFSGVWTNLINGQTPSSAKKYKTNIEDAGEFYTDYMSITPAQFNLKTNPDGNKLVGFIADDLVRTCPAAVVYDDEGEVEGVDARTLVAMNLTEIQKQRRLLDTVIARLTALETTINGGI